MTVISKRSPTRCDNLRKWNLLRRRQPPSLPALAHRVLRGAQLAALIGAVPMVLTPAAAGHAEEAARQPVRALDAAAMREVRALDCARVTAADVAHLLARGPTPRIILLQGSLAPVNMEPFADFLIAMGYPPQQIRDPRDGRTSQASFEGSQRWAGTLAWYYESEGTMPMLIGHSQGGMMAIRILYELDGAFHDDIPVWDPLSGVALTRTTIRDPHTGATRPVKGLTVGYVAAIATGKLPRIFLGQWDMIAKLRRIPDTAEDFTGFSIPWDPIAGTLGDPEPYAAIGTARVRNVTLPASTSHIRIPETRHLASNAATRSWIDDWSPETAVPMPEGAGVDTMNNLHAADIWFSVKKHWCQAAQQALAAPEGQ